MIYGTKKIQKFYTDQKNILLKFQIISFVLQLRQKMIYLKFTTLIKKKITVTYFGAEKFENIKIKENIKDYDKPFLLFVGSRGRYKNFNNFVEAFSKSEKLYKDFNIICFGGEEFSADEISLFNRLKIVDSVYKEKNNDDQTLFTLYKKAKCLVYPSTYHKDFFMRIIMRNLKISKKQLEDGLFRKRSSKIANVEELVLEKIFNEISKKIFEVKKIN